MAERGGQPGNRNSANAKLYQQALKRALARKAGSVDLGLDKLADRVVSLALDRGEQWAVIEVGNRIDGKPAQALEHTGPDGGPIEVTRAFLDESTDQLPAEAQESISVQ